jgi:hypothetical protein
MVASRNRVGKAEGRLDARSAIGVPPTKNSERGEVE